MLLGCPHETVLRLMFSQRLQTFSPSALFFLGSGKLVLSQLHPHAMSVIYCLLLAGARGGGELSWAGTDVYQRCWMHVHLSHAET